MWNKTEITSKAMHCVGFGGGCGGSCGGGGCGGCGGWGGGECGGG